MIPSSLCRPVLILVVRYCIVLSTIGTCSFASFLQSQDTLPTVTMTGTGAVSIARAPSAAEAAHHVLIKEGRTLQGLSFRASNYPIDSMQRAVVATGQQWLDQLSKHPGKGIQLDPSGKVGVAAKQESYAKQQIAERLATPGLSFGDRAFAYMTAVRAFSDSYYPDRLPDAERYLKQLDEMGNDAVYWQVQARRDIVNTYYMLGQSADVIRHGTRAIELMRVLHFFDRGLLIPTTRPGDGDGAVYNATVDALTGQPGGAAKIATLNKILQEVIVPSAAVVAMDSVYLHMAMRYDQEVKRMVGGNSRIGTPARPIISNYWVNRPTTDSAVVSVNDGKIHIIEVASWG